LRDSAGFQPASPFIRRPFGGGTRRGLQLVHACYQRGAVIGNTDHMTPERRAARAAFAVADIS
jgi:hypothetical protein